MANSPKYTWKTVPMKDIPPGIRTYLDKHFSSDVVFGIVKENQNTKTVYVLDVEHNGMYHHLKFDSEGVFISEKIEVPSGGEGEQFTNVGTGD